MCRRKFNLSFGAHLFLNSLMEVAALCNYNALSAQFLHQSTFTYFFLLICDFSGFYVNSIYFCVEKAHRCVVRSCILYNTVSQLEFLKLKPDSSPKFFSLGLDFQAKSRP